MVFIADNAKLYTSFGTDRKEIELSIMENHTECIIHLNRRQAFSLVGELLWFLDNE